MLKSASSNSLSSLRRDLTAGTVVSLVALPLCLGVALASGAPLFAGVLTGIVGGMLVGALSGSQTSVSGPAAGLAAIVAAEIAYLGSFEVFLLAALVAGVIQIALGLARAGFIAAFFPSSVIKGLLAAIGALLILKQIPHLLGHDTDPDGEMSFLQPDHQNTFSEFAQLLPDVHWGAALIGLASIAMLVAWNRSATLKKSLVPSQLIVVLVSAIVAQWFERLGGSWTIGPSHLVQVPVAASFREFFGYLRTPDFSQWTNPAIYTVGLTIAIVASLETLLNLEAVDKLDPQRRDSPPSRELLAQGIGNVVVSLIGGIPMTSVIVRGSVNIHAGAQSKLSTITHGALLLVCVMLLPTYLNMIPLSSLAAILIVTGAKLINPSLVRQMWHEGRYQFVPFLITLVAIVFTDLMIGVLIGLGVSLSFILNSSFRQPLRRIVEKHLGGDVLHIELASQVSFLNRAALEKAMQDVPRGAHLLLDAHSTDYIDPDILSLIHDFKDRTAPVRGVKVSLLGFRRKYELPNEIQYVDYATRQLQEQLSPAEILEVLRAGNERFRKGEKLTRDLHRQVHATAEGQHPLAVVLSCIDSRTPAELVFDLGLGDIFNVRVAGNISSPKVLGSIEYACGVAGAKLILVLGHTRCGAVTSAVKFAAAHEDAGRATGCEHLDSVVADIQQSIDPRSLACYPAMNADEQRAMIEQVAQNNVVRVAHDMLEDSHTLARLVNEGRVVVVGAIYDVSTAKVEFITGSALDQQPAVARA